MTFGHIGQKFGDLVHNVVHSRKLQKLHARNLGLLTLECLYALVDAYSTKFLFNRRQNKGLLLKLVSLAVVDSFGRGFTCLCVKCIDKRGDFAIRSVLGKCSLLWTTHLYTLGECKNSVQF